MQCKPHEFFHKRFGLQNHSKTRHGRDGVFKMPSIPSRCVSLPARRVTKSSDQVPRRNFATSASSVNNRMSAIKLVDLEEDDEEIQIVDYHEVVEETKSRSESSEPIEKKSMHEHDDIKIIDEIDVNENKIKSFKPENYRWMESSPLYQPKVFLSSKLNLEMRKEESKDDIELVKSLKDDIILVDLEQEVIVGEAKLGQYDEYLEQSTHVRNLFNGETAHSERKTYEVDNLSFKKSKHDQEELLLMEDDDNEVLDIQSMLEVSIDETEEVSSDVEYNDVLESSDIIEVDLELEELPEEEVELISLDEDANVEFDASSEPATNDKPGSIKDLVNLW